MCPKYCLLAFCLFQIFFFATAYVAEAYVEEDYADEGLLFDASTALVVEVQTKNIISFKDIYSNNASWRVLVKINNLENQPRSGNVSLALRAEYQADYPKYRKTVHVVNGEAEVSFNSSDLDMVFGRDEIEDKLTAEGKVRLEIKAFAEQKYEPAIATTTTTMLYNRYQFICLNYNSCHFYAFNVKQDVLYQITHVDGSYVNDAGSLVEMLFFKKNSTQWTDRHSAPMNETGFVNFQVALLSTDAADLDDEIVMQLNYDNDYSGIEEIYTEPRDMD